MPEPLTEHVADWRIAVVVEQSSRTIRNVALSGTESKNGYRYAESALREARPLYENTPVFLDHPASTQRPRDRSARDLAGSVVNVRYDADRLRGDIRTLDTEAGRTLLALAEADGPGVGMSHVVLAERSGDGLIVERIVEVISVDAVAFPATTRTFRERVENVAASAGERTARVRRVRRLMKHASEGRAGAAVPTEPGGVAERPALYSDIADPASGSGPSWPVSLERLLASVDAQLPGHLRRLAAASGVPSRGRGVRVGVFPSHVLIEWRSVGRPPEHFALDWRLEDDAVVLGESFVPAHAIPPALARWIDPFPHPHQETRPDTALERHAPPSAFAERGPTSVLRRSSDRVAIADEQFIHAIRRR